MALTLIEAAKLSSGDVYRSAIIELYAGSSPLMQVLPFTDIAGNSYRYNREAALPGVGFRGVNEAFESSTGVINPISEPIVIAGGDLDVDRFILQTMGMRQRSVQEAMKVRALGLMLTRKFIKGDQISNSREFDGLQTRVAGSQLIPAGTTAGGTPLSLSVLDRAIKKTLRPTHIIANTSFALRLTTASRTAGVAGNITFTEDAFGQQITRYNNLPILEMDLDGEGNEILPFTEAATSGAATASSIYVVSLGEDGVVGLQNGGISVRDLGELQVAPVYRTRVEWFMSIAVFNGRAATRVWSIADAPITA